MTFSIKSISITGTVQHEILGFFQRDPVAQSRERRTYHAVFYDCNLDSNLIGVARKFMNGLSVNCRGIYSNALHGLHNCDSAALNYNPEGICGQLTFLELLLHFEYSDNPFHRILKLRPILGNSKVGNHGPQMFFEEYVPSNRNRSIPKNQEGRRGCKRL